VALSGKANPRPEAFAQVLSTLASLEEPVAFEVIGTADNIRIQFAVHSSDAPPLERWIKAHCPEAILTTPETEFQELWQTEEEAEAAIVEFSLAREFIFSLEKNAPDVVVGIVAALNERSTVK
jgi:hypothetical protein